MKKDTEASYRGVLETIRIILEQYSDDIGWSAEETHRWILGAALADNLWEEATDEDVAELQDAINRPPTIEPR
jgi:hypothetical protein